MRPSRKILKSRPDREDHEDAHLEKDNIDILNRISILSLGSIMQLQVDRLHHHGLDKRIGLVIGNIGMDAVGKSMILSLLAKERYLKSKYYGLLSVRAEGDYFPMHSKENNRPTSTVDFLMTEARTVFLDTPPVCSVTKTIEWMSRGMGEQRQQYGPSSSESAMFMQSLQLLLWLLTVCDVLLVVQDSIKDSMMCRLLTTANMLWPTLKGERCAKVIVVANKTSEEIDYIPAFETGQKLLNDKFKDAIFATEGTVPFHVIPKQQQAHSHQEDFSISIRKLRFKVLSGVKDKPPCTLREWQSTAKHALEMIKSSKALVEYEHVVQNSYCMSLQNTNVNATKAKSSRLFKS